MTTNRSEAVELAHLMVLDPVRGYYWRVPFWPLPLPYPEFWTYTADLMTDAHVRGGCDDPSRLEWWVER